MNNFKEATKNLLHAGKTWVEAAIQTGSDQYTKRIEPRIESFKDRINREESHPFAKESRCETRHVA